MLFCDFICVVLYYTLCCTMCSILLYTVSYAHMIRCVVLCNVVILHTVVLCCCNVAMLCYTVLCACAVPCAVLCVVLVCHHCLYDLLYESPDGTRLAVYRRLDIYSSPVLFCSYLCASSAISFHFELF